MFVYLTKSPVVDVVSLGIHSFHYKPGYFPSFQKAIPFMPTELPQWLSGKESVCNAEDTGSNPWVGRIPWGRKWQPTPVFCLGNPMDRGAWQATVHGVPKELDTK